MELLPVKFVSFFKKMKKSSQSFNARIKNKDKIFTHQTVNTGALELKAIYCNHETYGTWNCNAPLFMQTFC